MTEASELPALLRGCVKWRDGRPWVDSHALLVVRDWCEEHERRDVADAIRTPVRMIRPRGMVAANPGVYAFPETGFAEVGDFCVHVHMHLFGEYATAQAVYRRVPRVNIETCPAGVDGEVQRWRHTDYSTDEGEYLPGGRVSAEALQRVRDLARWDIFCHMLGYPPLRLLGDE